ncbi:hypothetical protein SynMITS9220_01643 [Synechococcus sp. MIT S9220]|nr:hypothetical protein SynMITS9220_01643 [Synechococcus sp. MIT S9220]
MSPTPDDRATIDEMPRFGEAFLLTSSESDASPRVMGAKRKAALPGGKTA